MKYFVILICCLFSSCSLLETDGGDKDWTWIVNIVDAEGDDLFINYPGYQIDSLKWKVRGLPNDEVSDFYVLHEIRDSSETFTNIRVSLHTGFAYTASNGTEASYYMFYGNGDIDTIHVKVDGPGDFPIWNNDKWVNIDRIRYYFNGELFHDFNIKEDPSLEDQIKAWDSKINRLIFIKNSFTEDL